MCSLGTENKQAVSLSGAVPGRLHSTRDPRDVLANSRALQV